MDFLVYALLYRLAIILAGAVFMFFGFRLFLESIVSGAGTEMGGEHGGSKFWIKNAAPGTFFAFFGAALIGLMVWQGNPEMRKTEQGGDEVVMRGGPNPATDGFELARAIRSNMSSRNQISLYSGQLTDGSLSLEQASGPMMGLAAAFLRDDRPEEAISLVRLVYQFDGDQPDTLALMALIEDARGETETARQIMQRLTDLHPSQGTLVDDLKQDLLQ
ncbi:MAG: hypothetical protein AAFY52_08165 [Pseudomonadota bacterium]